MAAESASASTIAEDMQRSSSAEPLNYEQLFHSIHSQIEHDGCMCKLGLDVSQLSDCLLGDASLHESQHSDRKLLALSCIDLLLRQIRSQLARYALVCHTLKRLLHTLADGMLCLAETVCDKHTSQLVFRCLHSLILSLASFSTRSDTSLLTHTISVLCTHFVSSAIQLATDATRKCKYTAPAKRATINWVCCTNTLTLLQRLIEFNHGSLEDASEQCPRQCVQCRAPNGDDSASRFGDNYHEMKCSITEYLETNWHVYTSFVCSIGFLLGARLNTAHMDREHSQLAVAIVADIECRTRFIDRAHFLLAFVSLWTALLSVRNSLSIVDTKTLFRHIDQSISMLLRMHALTSLTSLAVSADADHQSSHIDESAEHASFLHDCCLSIWLAVLQLHSEVLCYGSTLALQSCVPEEPAALSHALVRAVKSGALLQRVPLTSHALRDLSSHGAPSLSHSILQLVVLVVLKSVVVTIKEARYNTDSSSSSSSCSSHTAVGAGTVDGCGATRRKRRRRHGAWNEADNSTDFTAESGPEHDMILIEKSLRSVLQQLDTWVKSLLPFHPDTRLCVWAPRLLSHDDAALVESLVCLLDLGAGFLSRSARQPREFLQTIDPFVAFVTFMHSVNYDTQLLLDFLVSNETCFLFYILRLLKTMVRHWARFVQACDSRADSVFGCLIRLRLVLQQLVQKQMFPYNISPVLRLLLRCETTYKSAVVCAD